MHSTKSTRSSCLAREAAPMGLTPHVVTYSSVHPGPKTYWSSVLERGHVTPHHSSARHWCISNDEVAPLLDTKKIKTLICPCVYSAPVGNFENWIRRLEKCLLTCQIGNFPKNQESLPNFSCQNEKLHSDNSQFCLAHVNWYTFLCVRKKIAINGIVNMTHNHTKFSCLGKHCARYLCTPELLGSDTQVRYCLVADDCNRCSSRSGVVAMLLCTGSE